MSTIKLNKSIRQIILNRLLTHRFGKECEALSCEKVSLAESIYNSIYSKKQRDAMGVLPKGWLPERGNFSITSAGVYVNVNLSGRLGNRFIGRGIVFKALDENDADKIYKRFLSKDTGVLKAFDANSDIAKKISKINDTEIDLSGKLEESSSKATSTMNNVTTISKLKAVWPEIEPFCFGFEKKVIQLPAVNTAELNSTFDLPVKDAA